jgi:hypothetical protein
MCDTKTCNICKESKPLDQFYTHPSTKDGRQSKCRECSRAYANKYARSERGQELRRKLRTKPEVRAKSKIRSSKNHHDPANYERRKKTLREYHKKNKYRSKANSMITSEIRQGKRLPASEVPCIFEADGTCYGKHNWHHDSYRKEDWGKVNCHCRSHHSRWHLKNTPTPYEAE